MTNKNSVSNPEETAPSRRGFLGTSFAALAIFAGGVSLPRLRTSPVGSRTGTRKVPAGDLRPTYLPKGYVFRTRYTDRPDGFGGGAAEEALWYTNGDYADADSNPLIIFITNHPTRAFGGTADHLGEELTLNGASRISNVVFHDGMWVGAASNPDRILANGSGVRWDVSRVNMLVGEIDGWTVGLRASKRHGAEKAELIQVLQSMAPQ